MKKYLLLIAALFAALLISQLIAAEAVVNPVIERELVDFPREMKIGDVIVKGSYLLIHDNEAALGEPCFSIYKTVNGKSTRLVTKFHCVRVDRNLAERFRYTSKRLPSGLYQLMEVQFANSTFGHRIPGVGFAP